MLLGRSADHRTVLPFRIKTWAGECRVDRLVSDVQMAFYRAGDEDPAELSDLDHWGDSVKGCEAFHLLTLFTLSPFHHWIDRFFHAVSVRRRLKMRRALFAGRYGGAVARPKA